MTPDVDDVDRSIIRELQDDARHNTNTAIGERIGVSASTVGKRITRLEDATVVEGYVPVLDHEAIGFPHHVLFVCSAPIGTRGGTVDEIGAIDGVVSVRELLTGAGNVHVQVVGASNDDVVATAASIEDLGVAVEEALVVRSESYCPSGRIDPGDTGGH